jgi:hypothetical protein
MKRIVTGLALALSVLATSCSQDARVRYPTTDQTLKLKRVVLYRNGVGYFERQGDISGDMLTLKVRKDQVNDLLKSLTIVDRQTGKAVSVSMPLDPQTWANAALATLAPGQGSLAQVLDALRGTEVVLDTTEGTVRGRIVMIEELQEEPDPAVAAMRGRAGMPASAMKDHRVTLMDLDEMKVTRLSKVRGITLTDVDLAMQFHRTLDATAGEGMFQQVEVGIRLTGSSSHDLVVSYVVASPMWKPTYRVVLPEKGKADGLLQGWAVVDNISSEDWSDIRLALTSGEPIAFRYDLHTPRGVDRTDLTETGVRKRASVAVGETSYGEEDKKNEPPPPPPPPPAAVAAAAPAPDMEYAEGDVGGAYDGAPGGGGGKGAPGPMKRKAGAKRPAASTPSSGTAQGYGRAGLLKDEMSRSRDQAPAEPTPSIDFDSLRRSTQAQARATMVSGLTRFDLDSAVTVPDGTSTMVAIINAPVQAEETFLFKPGGAGTGYESNPYRVVRFKNSTPFVLEPGPIAIYSGGSFVGEGLSEAVGANNSATIPFAVEPGIMVTSVAKQDGEEMKLIRIVHKVLEVESFARKTTTWSVKAQTRNDGFTVLIRHPKAGYGYDIKERPLGTEDLVDAYLVPLAVKAGSRTATVDVVEQTPSKISLTIWDSRAVDLLQNLLIATNVSPAERAKLQPIVELRQEIGRIDTKIASMEEQRNTLDQRSSETRRNLLAIAKDPRAADLRAKLNARLDDFTKEADRLGREIVELQSKRLEKQIALEDMMENLQFNAPPGLKPIKAGAAAAP